MNNHTTCKVSDCDATVKRAGFCYGHYMKNWRYGTPTPARPTKWNDLRGERFGTLVVISREGSKWLCHCDCGQQRHASAGDLNRYGGESTCGDRSTHRREVHAGYGAAHARVRTDRGPITRQQCGDCGQQAAHWSYDHDDPNELHASGLSAHPVAYSLDPAHYSPRCVPCHKRFDLGQTNGTPVTAMKRSRL